MILPRHGFALLELLVVISTIAILAAILVPTIGLVRDGAQSIICGSMQRQMAMANMTCASENDGKDIFDFGRDAASVPIHSPSTSRPMPTGHFLRRIP